MKCTIKAFGISREIVGGREMVMDVAEGLTVAEFKRQLYTAYPRLETLRSLFIAVNNEYAGDNRVLAGGDEVALIPPVSGG